MKYKALIGIEMHCEISNTNSKMFSSASNSYEVMPNKNISLGDFAFPGVLPLVNKEAVRKSLMASLMLNCKTPEYMYFERKNYFYPDLAKGYQITQETKPAPVGIYGYLDYFCNEEKRRARINNIHLEEDTSQLNHGANETTINFNRSGVPLLELVTEPDFRSAEEAVSFLESIRAMYEYADISEADSKKGQVRCDVNISIMEEDKEEVIENYGTRVEVKNVNSFSSVKECIIYEVNRQIKLKEDGTYDSMTQHTRRWNDLTGETEFMRSKEEALDYRYFIDPNIPKIKISDEWIEEIKKDIPSLPLERKENYINNYGISSKDANILVRSKNISNYFEECTRLGIPSKDASNWITSNIMEVLNRDMISIDDIFITPLMLKDLIDNINNGSISNKQAKEVFNYVLEEKKEPNVIIKEKGYEQNSNSEEILEVIRKVLDENPSVIEDIKNGKTKKTGYLVGQVLKLSNGKFNPGLTNKLLIQELNK